MKVLGFRSDPKAPRYAVISNDGGQDVLENASGDNRLTVPASIPEEADAERVAWIYREILRVFDEHPDITKVMIKANEFTQQDTKAKRRSAYTDATVMLASANRNLAVEVKIYASMPTTSADTKRHAESRVGRTEKFWDKKMADAVNVAWLGLRR